MLKPAGNVPFTKRAVLYVGYNCNAKCCFCHYHWKKWDWRSLEDCMKDAAKFRFEFGNSTVDITGGEPSVYPHIVELLIYCRKIGLRPTIITNGLVMKKRAREFHDAGLVGTLSSVHTVSNMDDVYGVKDAFRKIDTGLDTIASMMSLRTNTTIIRQNYHELCEITKYVIGKGAEVVNFIPFNARHEWRDKIEIEHQISHSTHAPYLDNAVQIAEDNGVRANIRYIPFCMFPDRYPNMSNWGQLPYDPHEWDLRSWLDEWYHWLPGTTYKAMSLAVRKKVCRKSPRCKECALDPICDGVGAQYLDRYGDPELVPIKGDLVTNMDHYRKEQLV